MKVEQGLSWAVVLGFVNIFHILHVFCYCGRRTPPLNGQFGALSVRGAWAPSALALKNQLRGRQSK